MRIHTEINRRHVLAAGAALPLLNVKASAGETTLVEQVRAQVVQRMQENAIPGLAATLLIDGKPLWSGTFGKTDSTPDGRAIDPHTIFSLQSCSKTFTAAAVLLGVQKGLLDLDRPITAYVPDFRVNSRHEENPQERMTLRILLGHRAGFTHEAPVGNNFNLTPWTFDSHIRSIEDTWLRYPVGERHAYSNLGLDLAARILERVSGMSYDKCLKAWLLEPLGMADTTADPDVYEARTNRAVGHLAGFAKLPVRIPLLGSGGVYASITDMARYAAFHLNRGRFAGKQLLDTQLWREMYDFRISPNYGLGMGRWNLTLSNGAAEMFGHDGGGFGFACCFNHVPAEGVALVVLSNGSTKQGGNPNPFDSILLDPVLKSRGVVPTSLPPPATSAFVMAKETLQRWVGSYLNGDARADLTLEADTLVFRRRGDTAGNKLTFIAADEAWVREGPLKPQTFRFHDAKGLEAQWFATGDGTIWDFNDGPGVDSGALGTEYDSVVGQYEIDDFGVPVMRATVAKKNGWLYFEDVRLTPYRTGLLFGGSGEALDLRGATATARNIPLKRL